MTATAIAAVATALEVARGEDHEAVLDVKVLSFGERTFELKYVDLLRSVCTGGFGVVGNGGRARARGGRGRPT